MNERGGERAPEPAVAGEFEGPVTSSIDQAKQAGAFSSSPSPEVKSSSTIFSTSACGWAIRTPK